MATLLWTPSNSHSLNLNLNLNLNGKQSPLKLNANPSLHFNRRFRRFNTAISCNSTNHNDADTKPQSQSQAIQLYSQIERFFLFNLIIQGIHNKTNLWFMDFFADQLLLLLDNHRMHGVQQTGLKWRQLYTITTNHVYNYFMHQHFQVNAHCIISGIMDSQTQKLQTQFCCTFCGRYICRSCTSAYLPLVP